MSKRINSIYFFNFVKYLLLIMVAFIFISCAEEQKDYYIKLNSSSLESINLEVGEKINIIEDKVISEYKGTLLIKYNNEYSDVNNNQTIKLDEFTLEGYTPGKCEIKIYIEEDETIYEIIKIVVTEPEQIQPDHIHNFNLEVVDGKYLCQEATYDSPSLYYKSCECGDFNKDSQNVFLYGDKLLKEYMITFDLDGGECDSLSNGLIIKFNENEKITLPVPNKLSYEFLGWYQIDQSNGEESKEPFDDKSLENINALEYLNIHLVAKWQKVKVVITLDVNGGSILENESNITDPTNNQYLYDLNSDIKLPLPEREGYAFMGWSETKYGAWIDKYTYNKVKYHTDEEDVKLYALWICNEYKHYCIEDTFENNPWHYIYYVSSLNDLMSLPNNGYVYLENDINVRNKEWTPLGTLDNPYMGYFDGCGYTIRNIKINSDNNEVGFFGVTEGYVYNLNLVNITVTSTSDENDSYVGTLFGVHNKGKIYNVTIDNAQVSAKVGTVGALGGKSNGAYEKVVVNCSLKLDDFNGNASGFIGEKSVHSANNPDYSKVLKCKSIVTVEISSKNNNINTNIALSALYYKVYNKVLTEETVVEMTLTGDANIRINGFSDEIDNSIIKDSYLIINGKVSNNRETSVFANKCNNSNFENCYVYFDDLDNNIDNCKYFNSINNSTVIRCFSNVLLNDEINQTENKIVFLESIGEIVFNDLLFDREKWIIVDNILMLRWEK